MMAASGVPKRIKLDEAQALAKISAGRPYFLSCDGLSISATRSHGKCFKLHWCCHLGWCHCKYVYQPMTSVCQHPSTMVPATASGIGNTVHLSDLLRDRFLRTAPCYLPPPCPESPRYCVISDLFIEDYVVKRINGKMCYVPRHHPLAPTPTPYPGPAPAITPPSQALNAGHAEGKLTPPSQKALAPEIDHCSSPSNSEDSGINAVGLHFLESCDEASEQEDDEELSSDGDSSPSSLRYRDECSLISPSKSTVEILEQIETTV